MPRALHRVHHVLLLARERVPIWVVQFMSEFIMSSTRGNGAALARWDPKAVGLADGVGKRLPGKVMVLIRPLAAGEYRGVGRRSQDLRQQRVRIKRDARHQLVQLSAERRRRCLGKKQGRLQSRQDRQRHRAFLMLCNLFSSKTRRRRPRPGSLPYRDIFKRRPQADRECSNCRLAQRELLQEPPAGRMPMKLSLKALRCSC